MTSRVNTKSNSILIDLDSVLDTRHPTIYALDPDTAEQVVSNNTYKNRVKDEFGNISNDIFNFFYKKRSKDILTLALPTPMIKQLNEYCVASYSAAVMSKDECKAILYVNTYPYVLNDIETSNIVDIFDSVIDVCMDIEVIYIPDSELTPSRVNNMCSVFIKYNFLEWIEYHSTTRTLYKSGLLDVACIAPALANGCMKAIDISNKDFEFITDGLRLYTNLALIKTEMFSFS